MLRDNHVISYTLLASLLFLAFGLFVHFKYQPHLQIFLGFLGCLVYASWGIFHHAGEDRITPLVVFEYLFFSLISFLLITLFVTLY